MCVLIIIDDLLPYEPYYACSYWASGQVFASLSYAMLRNHRMWHKLKMKIDDKLKYPYSPVSVPNIMIRYPDTLTVSESIKIATRDILNTLRLLSSYHFITTRARRYSVTIVEKIHCNKVFIVNFRSLIAGHLWLTSVGLSLVSATLCCHTTTPCSTRLIAVWTASILQLPLWSDLSSLSSPKMQRPTPLTHSSWLEAAFSSALS